MFPVEILRAVDEKMGMKPEYHHSCWMLENTQTSEQ